MSSRVARVTVPALLIVALVAAGAPLATACEPGTEGYVLGVVTTCPVNEDLATAVAALNAASDGSVAYVLVKDFRFFPEVVTVASGGTVVWVYADTDQAQQHDPRSSGSCGSQALDLARCAPTSSAKCFDVFKDDRQFMKSPGDTYPVSFRYDADAGLIEKSRGVQSGGPVGDLTGAQAYRDCPPGTSSNAPESGVIAYHCGIHGGSDTPRKGMRGAIVVEA